MLKARNNSSASRMACFPFKKPSPCQRHWASNKNSVLRSSNRYGQITRWIPSGCATARDTKERRMKWEAMEQIEGWCSASLCSRDTRVCQLRNNCLLPQIHTQIKRNCRHLNATYPVALKTYYVMLPMLSTFRSCQIDFFREAESDTRNHVQNISSMFYVQVRTFLVTKLQQ